MPQIQTVSSSRFSSPLSRQERRTLSKTLTEGSGISIPACYKDEQWLIQVSRFSAIYLQSIACVGVSLSDNKCNAKRNWRGGKGRREMLLQFLFLSTFSQRSSVATSVPKYEGTWNHLPSESLPFVRYRSP